MGVLPAWLSKDDLDVYAGALKRYRNMDRDWEELCGCR